MTEELDDITLAWLQREQEINEDAAAAHAAIDAAVSEAHTYSQAWMNVAATRLGERFPDLLSLMRRVEEHGSDTPPYGLPPVDPEALTQPIIFAGELVSPTYEEDPDFPDSLLPRRDHVGDIIAALRPAEEVTENDGGDGT